MRRGDRPWSSKTREDKWCSKNGRLDYQAATDAALDCESMAQDYETTDPHSGRGDHSTSQLADLVRQLVLELRRLDAEVRVLRRQ